MAAPLLSNPFKKAGDDNLTQGSCLCGAVTFTLSGAPSTTVLCHCISCKKASGSSFQANGFYELSQLIITSPTSSQSKIKIYTDTSPDSGGTVNRVFCSECGSRLWNTNPKYRDAVIVHSGVLDLSPEEWEVWRPEREFYCKRKGSWLESAEAGSEGRFQGMS